MKLSIWVAIVLCAGAAVAAESRPLSVKWNELEAAAGESKVALILPDTTRIEGRVLRVEPEGLRLRITKTSDRKAHPKGETLIEKRSVRFLRVIEYRHIGRILCTVGAVAAVAGIAWAGSHGVHEGALLIAIPAAGAAGAVGAGIGGYYLGKAFDRRLTEIRIVEGN